MLQGSRILQLAAALLIFAEPSANACQPVDLRRPDLNLPRTQTFKGADGKEKDSQFCASYSSALLISQQMGVSIDPIDYAFQNMLIRNSLANEKTREYCRGKNVAKYLGKEASGFMQTVNDFVRPFYGHEMSGNIFFTMNESERRKVNLWLNEICGERIPLPSFEYSTIDLRPAEESDWWTSQRWRYMTKAEMVVRINQLLDAGHFVGYTHSLHAVTIVGRTADCRYIIQDSIPESYWKSHGGLLTPGYIYKDDLSAQIDRDQIVFENQVFQYWPRAILLKNASRISFVRMKMKR